MRRIIEGVPVRPPGLIVPAIAAAVGYNCRTFGGNLTLGQNWNNFNWLGATPVAGQSTQNPDGTVTLISDGSGYGGGICTAKKVGSSWTGKVFGGGAFYRAIFKHGVTISGSPGSLPMPAWWDLDIDFLMGNTHTWPGQAGNYLHRIERDLYQWAKDSTLFYQPAGMLDWYGTTNPMLTVTLPTSTGEVSAHGADLSQYNEFWSLWVCATPTKAGYWLNWINGIRVLPAATPLVATWNYWDPANPPSPPPVAGTTAMSFMDQLKFPLIFGTATSNPMQIALCEVWQTSDANNITQ